MPGDDAPLVIPKGPVEIELAADSTTLSWIAGNGVAGVAAIPLTQYKMHVEQRRIFAVELATAAITAY